MTIEIKHKPSGKVLIVVDGADLRGANLYGADLYDAHLYGARGIMVFGPIGDENRVCFAYLKNGIRFRIECFNGNHNQAIDAVREKYGENSYYEMMIRSVAWSLAATII